MRCFQYHEAIGSWWSAHKRKQPTTNLNKSKLLLGKFMMMVPYMIYIEIPLLPSYGPGRYVDSSGRVRFVGTRALKKSQFFSCITYREKSITIAATLQHFLVNFEILREYPTALGKRLLEVYQSSSREPLQQDLRRKFTLDQRMSDKELFRDYPCHPDQWFDANLPAAFWYLLEPLLKYSRLIERCHDRLHYWTETSYRTCLNWEQLDFVFELFDCIRDFIMKCWQLWANRTDGQAGQNSD